MPVYQESDGVDGRVSLEVLPELATNTEKTVAEGLRLAKLVGRPNVMIKVPATPEGIPAIRALTAPGRQRQRHADLLAAPVRGGRRGLPGRASRIAWPRRHASTGLASVASFFVSRVDSVCDKQLKREGGRRRPTEAARCQALLGKIGIANAKMAYDIYERTVASPRWKTLAAAGAQPQRLLWASTGTKDPALPGHLLRRRAARRATPSTPCRPRRSTPSSITASRRSRSRTTSRARKQAVAEFAALGIDLGASATACSPTA